MKSKKIEIINVIEIVNGVLNSLESVVITNSSDKLRTEAIAEAEQLFAKKAKENGLRDKDMEAAIENGEYDDNSGYNVLLRWSDRTKTI